MSKSIRIAPSSTDFGTDLGRAHPAARTNTATPSSPSLPKGGSQIESLKSLGSRAAAGKTAAGTARAPLTRELPFREWIAPTAAPATSHDDEWSELDDIFRRQPEAGQAGSGAPAHSLIDAPQTPLRKNVSTSAPPGPAARPEPARTGSSGMLGAIKRSAKSLLGLGRSSSLSSPPTPKQGATSRPLQAASRPVTAPADAVAETVAWIHEQNGRPSAWRNAIPKLSVEQARREGKPVPTRRPPSPPMAGSAGPAAHPGAFTIGQNNPAKPKLGSGAASTRKTQPQPPEAAPRRGQPSATATPRRTAKRPPRAGVDFHLPKLGPLSTIPENPHESGALASMGQHYDGLWRDLRGSINGANHALQSLKTTPRKGLAAKRAELESHAAELKRLIAEAGMAEVDLATVQALKNLEAPESPNKPDSLRTRAVLVDRDIHETGRQRNHARVALDRLQRAIASLPPSTGR